ncbi:MAG: molybdopterin-dependent oxidoreductase [Negativicutes bacterium]
MPKQIITTCTRDCPNACGLIAVVENGRVTELAGNPDHPVTQGFRCHKCKAFVARSYSPDRILTPLKRQGANWKPISWEAAMDEVAGRLQEAKDYYGPESILYYRGFAQRTALKLLNDRFFNLFGGVTGTRGTLCGGTGQASQNLDYGSRVSHDPLDHMNAKTLVIWGRNPVATNPYLARIAAAIRHNGGTVLLIDPVASESAGLADVFLQPQPGGDVWLALALSKLVLRADAADQAFLQNHCVHWPEYRAIVDRYSLTELSDRCDIPVTLLEKVASILIHSRPVAFSLGWGLHRWEFAHYAIRAIDALGAVVGSIGVAGGGVSQGFEEYAPYDLSWVADDLHPHRRKLLTPIIGQEILDAEPPIQVLMVTAGNPVCMSPNAAKVARAFQTIPFKVVVGHFLDDTAQLADIFLPSATLIEEDDIVAGYGHNIVGPVNPAVSPIGDARSDFDIFQDLGRRLLPPDADFVLPRLEWLKRLLAPTEALGISLDDIKSGPVRLASAPMVPFADHRFPTPSGKFQLLDEYLPPKNSGEEFPYWLLSIAPHQWLCSEMTPGEQAGLTEIRLHPLEAKNLQLSDGDTVIVENTVGQTLARLRTDGRQRRDVVVFPRGRWKSSGSNVNLLTRDIVSRVGNGTPYYDNKVRIRSYNEQGTGGAL